MMFYSIGKSGQQGFIGYGLTLTFSEKESLGITPVVSILPQDDFDILKDHKMKLERKSR